MLRCPDPSCAAAVGQDIINLLASKDDKEKYNRYFLRSFIEDNWKVLGMKRKAKYISIWSNKYETL